MGYSDRGGLCRGVGVGPMMGFRMLRVFVAGIALVAVSSCRHPAPERGMTTTPRLIFEPGQDFFSTPFPADARRTRAGAPDYTGFPNPEGIGFVTAAIEATAALDGFDPSSSIYFRFDGPLPIPHDHAVDTERYVPGITVVDIDPRSQEYGRRFPARVRATRRHDGIRPAHLLQVLPEPGVMLKEKTTYAVLVDKDLDQDGTTDLEPALRLQALWQTEGDDEDTWRASFAPLRAFLRDTNRAPQSLAAATVFTTGEPSAALFRFVEEALSGPAPALAGPLQRERDYEDYVVLRGHVRMPLFQEGTPPHFFAGGTFRFDESGRLGQTDTVDALFYLTIPKGEIPASGIPLYFYVHGTGGHATQAIDRGYRRSKEDVAAPGSGLASWVAPLGYATSCMAGAYSPDRIGWRALDGYAAYMFFNPAAMRDNLRQMALEQVLFLRLLEELELDPALLPEVKPLAADGKIRFAKTRRIIGGQSLGSYLSGMLTALTGSFEGAILTGAGGSWTEFGFGPKDPVDLTALLNQISMRRGETLDPHHPFIHVFQNAVGAADNTHYLPYILRRPKAGRLVPHVLAIQGQRDLQVPVNLQRALTLAIGLDLVGLETGRTEDEQLFPVLRFGPLRQVVAGLGGNRRQKDGSVRTAVTVRHPEDGILEGHYVIFQQPAAKAQLVEFVKDIAEGKTPFVSGTAGSR